MAVRFMVVFLIRSGDSYYFTLSDIPGDWVVSFRLLNTVRRRRRRVAIVVALSHWQKDSNQSCFHDKAAQDKLPAEEQSDVPTSGRRSGLRARSQLKCPRLLVIHTHPFDFPRSLAITDEGQRTN